MLSTWTIPAPDGGLPREEQLLALDRGRAVRVLVCPAWFDEANKLRRFTVEVMRRLDGAGIDSLLPDLPGCNESLVPLGDQTVAGWRSMLAEAASSLRATHVLAIRAGALVAPRHLPGWHYATLSGDKLLRGMLRSQLVAAREAETSTTSEQFLATGLKQGLMLGGWQLGAAMLGELGSAAPQPGPGQSAIAQSDVGGAGLWLRAEPDDDATQADRLAALIIESLARTSG